MKALQSALAGLLLAIVAVSAHAQEVIVHQKPIHLRHLAGDVVDPKGLPVDYATVELLSADDHHMLLSTFADGNGKFFFADRKRGEELQVRVSRAGFKIAQYTIVLSRFGKPRVRVVLPPAA